MVGGANESEGRVEICINNAWGTICDSGFTKEDAKVVCRQLELLQIEGRVEVHIMSPPAVLVSFSSSSMRMGLHTHSRDFPDYKIEICSCTSKQLHLTY